MQEKKEKKEREESEAFAGRRGSGSRRGSSNDSRDKKEKEENKEKNKEGKEAKRKECSRSSSGTSMSSGSGSSDSLKHKEAMLDKEETNSAGRNTLLAAGRRDINSMSGDINDSLTNKEAMQQKEHEKKNKEEEHESLTRCDQMSRLVKAGQIGAASTDEEWRQFVRETLIQMKRQEAAEHEEDLEQRLQQQQHQETQQQQQPQQQQHTAAAAKAAAAPRAKLGAAKTAVDREGKTREVRSLAFAEADFACGGDDNDGRLEDDNTADDDSGVRFDSEESKVAEDCSNGCLYANSYEAQCQLRMLSKRQAAKLRKGNCIRCGTPAGSNTTRHNCSDKPFARRCSEKGHVDVLLNGADSGFGCPVKLQETGNWDNPAGVETEHP